MNRYLLLGAGLIALGACAPAPQSQSAQTQAGRTQTQASSGAQAQGSGVDWNRTTGRTAAASLRDASGKSVGTVTFAETTGGLRVIVRVKGVAPGQYATAVHAGNACAAAGDVFLGSSGTLENLEVGQNGEDVVSTLKARLTVASGPASVVGRTVLVKSGSNSVACGVIGSAE